MAYMIQQRPQQISTESLACQKRKSVADKSSRCEASSFFLPSFRIPLNGFNKINGGICFRHHNHNTGRCDRSSNNVWRGGKRYQDTYHTHLWCEVRCHPSPSKTETQNDNQSKIQQESGQDHRLHPQSQERGARSHCPWSEWPYRYWHTHRRLQSSVRITPVTKSESRTYSNLISCQ